MIEQAVETEVRLKFSANTGSIWSGIQRQVKRGAISQAMHETRNNQSAAALALGINRASLNTYIRQVFSAAEMNDMGIEP